MQSIQMLFQVNADDFVWFVELTVQPTALIVKEFSVPRDELFVECPNEAAVPVREVPMVIRKSSGLQFVRIC